MATTTNYGWTTPDDTALVKDGASAIRSLGTSVDTTTKNLNPSTTLGDIEYRSSTANTNTRLGIGSTGQVLTVSGGVPAWTTISSAPAFVGCRLTKSAAQTLSNSVATAITWNTESFDTNTFHDLSTNTSRITIPSGKAGKYLITGYAGFDENASGSRNLYLYKNGVLISVLLQLKPAGNTEDQETFTSIQSLAEADYIELYAMQSSGGDLNFPRNSDVSSRVEFSIEYLGA